MKNEPERLNYYGQHRPDKFKHCPHCKYCEMNHPYPCEDPTCKEGNTKLKET